MATFTSFEEIHAWKESRILLNSIRRVCKRSTVQRDFSFVDQITRAARSVSANIAEGNDAGGNREFIRFLRYAKRSAAEVRSHLYDALDETYITEQEFTALSEQADKVTRMIGKLIVYLRNAQTRKHVTL